MHLPRSQDEGLVRKVTDIARNQERLTGLPRLDDDIEEDRVARIWKVNIQKRSLDKLAKGLHSSDHVVHNCVRKGELGSEEHLPVFIEYRKVEQRHDHPVEDEAEYRTGDGIPLQHRRHEHIRVYDRPELHAFPSEREAAISALISSSVISATPDSAARREASRNA